MFDTGNNNEKNNSNIRNNATTIATIALGKKKIAFFSFAAITTFSFLIVFLVIFVTIIAGNMDTNDGYDNVYSGTNECGFTISNTSLSKSEFKQKIQDYANSHSQWQVFADYANDYYDYAKAKGVNPELVVVVAYKEHNGYTTGGANNYWGLACPNGSTSCKSYSSFMEGAKVLIDSASKYDTLREWFEVGSYSYIGYFWYNLYLDRTGDGKTEAWGDGGCIYASYIYPDGLPDRVAKACNVSNPTCDIQDTDYSDYQKWKKTGVNPRPQCTPTTDEDQSMYTTYLIKEQMGKARKKIFGLEFEEGVNVDGDAVVGDGIKTGTMTHPCPGLTSVSSEFGGREQPLPGASTNHKGIDLAAPTGTPVYAADGGKVIWSQYTGNAGKYIAIEHGDGLITQYMHLDEMHVKVGDKVSKGQKIGEVGNTGNSTGPHLHFGIITNGILGGDNAVYENPRNYINF